ncbi:SMP-30/gluconolactonase/LRE family protein [Altererythrobacter salegens]|uniref:SMP-30/gluconolactonase/LRE family protein n=1 Tax=Croceibacterium salegens TaxID=1737568 RepID=A0A6I4SW34_9SPHN|nr:SMP-30/gluconolactonase/LRE family protein [Croceibacterium salegens]MXO60093.1 SMP-30/gluconolactonase/LRE family protein [Croceibacterium salegens]
MRISRLDLPKCKVGEGPVWDFAEQALYYIDIVGKAVFRWDPATNDLKSWDVPDIIGSMALREEGGAIVALGTGVHLLDFASGTVEPHALLDPPDPEVQLADGKVDRRGRFVFGTSHRKMAHPVGGLYSLDRGVLTQVDDDVHLGNGPCWSPDDRVLYHADSLRHTIYAYDYDIETGQAANRRAFFNSEKWGPIPDGATVDADGNLWSAICEGGVVLCISPAGEVLREIEFPTRIPASVMFFGPDLDRLFVPTIDPSFIPGREAGPDDGANYVIDDLGVRGLPETRYNG